MPSEAGAPEQASPDVQDRLVEEGYNPAYGARPLRRAIMRLLEDSMAERMLSGDIKEGDSVIIDVDADGQVRPAQKLPILLALRWRGSLSRLHRRSKPSIVGSFA